MTRRRPAVVRREQDRLWFDALERRLALAATPTAIVSGGTGSLIGQEIPLTVTFDNTSANPADIGYSPYVDIVMPATGNAPPSPYNGISFKPGSATYNGVALPTTVVTFDAAGKATHPFAKDNAGKPLVVSGKPGDQLVVTQLPFGSYGPAQPPAAINFTGVVSSLAKPNDPYTITATGGFQYQLDTNGNPTVDQATVGATDDEAVRPQLFRIRKTSSAPEGETATGPNFQHTYTVSVDVAPGQTITNLQLSDLLPDNVQFVSLTSVSGNQTTAITIDSTPSRTVPGGILARTLNRVVGTASESDAQMTFTYFVPRNDKNGAEVIDLETGGTALAVNQVTARGTWASANPNFPDPQVVVADPAQHTLTAKTTALQKSARDITSPTTVTRAGDTIEYTLNFQVSDFFALENFEISDVLTDGQDFDTSFTPTITYRQKSQTFTTRPFAPANFTVAVQGDNTTTVDFNVSSQLDALGLVTGRKLLGAGVPNAGTGNPATLPTANPSGPGTSGTITFRTKIRNKYRDGQDVVQGDVVSDTATSSATVLDYATLAPTANPVGDTSNAAVVLSSGAMTKSVYAVNGATVTGTPSVKAGDSVTFRLTYSLPFSSIKDYTLTDFLPLPIFAAQPLTLAGASGPSAASPAAGQWKFGPSDTYRSISGITPASPTVDSAANSLTWNFGTFEDNQNRSATTDILFTLTASNRPFADGLLLTNQGEQREVNTAGVPLTNTGLAQVKMAEPQLKITKGVVSTSNPSGVFTPTAVAPAGVTFSKPGTAGASFTGTVTSGGLASQPIDATLSNVLGNDLVRFCIIVENTGSGPNGAFDVSFRDTFDATKMRIPGGGSALNLRVTDGTGAVMGVTDLGGGIFGSGLLLNDPGPSSAAPGSLDPGKTTAGAVINNGRNIAVITYDMQLLPGVLPSDVIPNTATVTNYAATEGGPNFVPGGISDATTVTVMVPKVEKTLISTSIPGNGVDKAVIGEKATFELKVLLPPGTTTDTLVKDSLPPGLAFVRMVAAPVVDPGVTVSNVNWATPTVSDSGRTLDFNLGTVTNTATDRSLRGVTVRYEAVVLNVSTNVNFQTLTNSAELTWTNHGELPAAKSAPITVIEPKLKVTKTPSTSVAQAGDTVTYTIVLAHAPDSRADAQNVAFADVIPDGLTYVPGSLQRTAGLAPTTLVAPGAGGNPPDTFTATFDTFAQGQTTTFTFQAKLDPDVIAGSALVNVARDTWTSLPGADPGLITPNNPNAYERTGSGLTNRGQLNNYEAEGAATVTVAQPSVTKSLVSTSIVNATNSNSQAVIGELATYTVTVKIPQGRTPAAKLVDLMAPGLAYVRTVSAVNDDPTVLTVPGLLTPPTFPTGGQTITYDLGDIVNSDTNPATDETVTFTIEAVVLNVKANVGGVQVVNRANLEWQAGASEFVTPTATSDPVTVIEPKVSTTKSVAVGGNGGNVGDPVTYTITIRQDATSPTDAFGVKLDDVLPPGITAAALTSVVDTAGVVTAANFNLAGNTLSTTTPFDLPKETVGRVIQLINGSQQRASTVLNGGGVFTSSFKGVNDATITLLARPATTPMRPEFVDVFPAASATCNNPASISSFVGATANGTGNGQPGGINQLEPQKPSSLQFDFAIPLTPDDRFLVTDVDANERYTITAFSKTAAGYTQVALTGWNHQSLTGMTGRLPNSSWAVWNPTGAGPLAGTLTAGTSGLLTQPLDTFAPSQSIDRVVITSSAAGNGTPGLQFYGLAPAAPSRTITLTVTGTIASGVTAGQKVTNTNTVSWTSLPGPTTQITLNNADAFERTGSGSTSDGELNNYNTTGSATFTVNSADLAVVKTVSNSTPNVGDEITFTVTVTNNGPQVANNVEITDQFPLSPELEYVSATAPSGTSFVYTASTGTGVWTVGTMNVGGANAKSLTIKAKVKAPVAAGAIPAPQTNTASVTKVDELDPNPGNNTGTATETPKYADLAVTKTVSNIEPNVGVPFTYEIILRNNGSATATGVQVTDTLPANVTITGSTAPSGTTFTGTVWTVPSIAAGQTLKLVLTAVASQPGVGTNRAAITKSDVYDPVDGNNTDETTTDSQAADLFLTKTVDNPTPNVGDEIEFTVVLENLGPNVAKDIVVTDNLPAGLEFVSASATEGSYSDATGKWTFDPGFELAVGQTVTLRIKATVAKPLTGPALTQVNTATATTSTTDPNLQNNTDSAEEIPQQADLAVTKIVSNPTPNVGDEITFTITVANLGPNTATNVRVVDTFPSDELELVSAVAPVGTSFDAVTGVWTVGTVTTAVRPQLTITARVKAPAPGNNPAPATNTATIPTSGPLKPDQYDPDPSNNSGSVTETPQYADLAVEKVVSDAKPKVGDTIVYTISVTNNGADTATGVSVVDQLPAGLQLISASANQGTYNAGTGVWTVGTVDQAFARTLSIVAKVLPPVAGSPPPRINTAEIPTSGPLKPAQYDPDPDNNTSQVTITPQYADLAVDKVVDNPRPNVGEEVTFTITLTNQGADAAGDVIITDKLPAGLSFLSADPSQGSYDPVTGAWDVGAVLTGPATYTLQIVALVTYPFRQINVATVTASNQYDPDPANNTDDAEINKGREWIVVGPDLGCDTGIESRAVRVVDPVTGVEWSRFFPFGSDFRGGVSLATADLLGTGVPVIIVGSGRGRPGEVRVFTQDGMELPAYRTLPYGPGYTLGINVAAGDVTGDGVSDIVTSQALGQAQVRGFAVDPKAADPVANSPAFSFAAGPGSGASIATADIVPGGRQEIVVGSGAGVRAQVRVLDVNGASPRVIKTVLPFNNAFLAGVSVSTGRVNADDVPDIIVAAGNGGGGGSRIEIWDGDPAANARLAAFAAFADSRKPDAAVFAAGLDTNGDGLIDQLAVVQGAGGVTNEVREFDLTDASLQPGPNPYTATLRRKLTQRAPMRITTLRGN